MTATIAADGQLVSDEPRHSTSAVGHAAIVDALRLEAHSMKARGDSSGMADRFLDVADGLSKSGDAMASRVASGRMTDIGLQEEQRLLLDPWFKKANAFDSEAEAIEIAGAIPFDQEWSRIMAPLTDAEFPRHEYYAKRLQGEDPVYFEQLMLAAAREGRTELLRAVLALLAPPLTIGPEQKWRNPVNADLLAKIKEAVRERVSPQGPQAWKAMRLRGLAKQLRSLRLR